jgi:hypothetical protein
MEQCGKKEVRTRIWTGESAIADISSRRRLHPWRTVMRLKARLRNLPVQTSTGAIHERRQKDEKQTGKMHDSPPVPKKETSVQRARRTATRHANESRMPPVLKPQILQKAAESLVSHCWTRETAASSPETLKNRHGPRQPLLDKGRCRSLNPKQTPQETTANHRQPLLDKGEHCQAQSATRSRIALRQPLLDSGIRDDKMPNEPTLNSEPSSAIARLGHVLSKKTPSPKYRKTQEPTNALVCHYRLRHVLAEKTGSPRNHMAQKPTSALVCHCRLGQVLAEKPRSPGYNKTLQLTAVVSQCWTRECAGREAKKKKSVQRQQPAYQFASKEAAW